MSERAFPLVAPARDAVAVQDGCELRCPRQHRVPASARQTRRLLQRPLPGRRRGPAEPSQQVVNEDPVTLLIVPSPLNHARVPRDAPASLRAYDHHGRPPERLRLEPPAHSAPCPPGTATLLDFDTHASCPPTSGEVARVQPCSERCDECRRTVFPLAPCGRPQGRIDDRCAARDRPLALGLGRPACSSGPIQDRRRRPPPAEVSSGAPFVEVRRIAGTQEDENRQPGVRSVLYLGCGLVPRSQSRQACADSLAIRRDGPPA